MTTRVFGLFKTGIDVKNNNNNNNNCNNNNGNITINEDMGSIISSNIYKRDNLRKKMF